MCSAKFLKYSIVFVLLSCSACRFWQNSPNSNISSNQPQIVESESEIPFSTKEPENFQTEIVTRFENETEKKFLAQSRGRFFLRQGEIATLQTDLGKSFALNFAKKIYLENIEKVSSLKVPSGETLEDFLTTEWLNQKTEAKFESLGEADGLEKFRVVFENSESLIFVDKNLKMPIRQEFYSGSGEAKILVYSVELQKFKLAVDENMFVIPKDFRKVSPEEFQKSLRPESN